MSDSVSVPDVLDETTASAQQKLEAVGLTLGTISTEKNPGGIPGTVLRISPELGSLVPQGSAIDLVIIEAADALAVPNVVGLTRPNAEEQLKLAGLRVGAVSMEKTSESTAGTVVRTSPGAGGQAAPNSGVDLVLAGLPELTVMPDCTAPGPAADYWVKFFTERGFRVEVERLTTQHDLSNMLVFRQYPPAGFSLEPGQRVMLQCGFD